MVKITMQYFGGNGASSKKAGAGDVKISDVSNRQSILNNPTEHNLSEINKALNYNEEHLTLRGTKILVPDRAVETSLQNFPQGTSLTVTSNAGAVETYTKTGKDTWTRDAKKDKKKYYTSTLLYERNAGAKNLEIKSIGK